MDVKMILSAAKLVIDENYASTQMLCRYISDHKGDLILYDTAKKIMAVLEEIGVVSRLEGVPGKQINGVKKKILITDIKQVEQLLTQLTF